MELLIGAGSRREKIIALDGTPTTWTNLKTLDFNGDHGVDIVHDLNVFPWPIEDNSCDEVHAYEVMEHLGQQGDFRRFFQDFSEIYRILKPDGLFCGTSPFWASAWAWGDPGHTRIISAESFIYLDQTEYRQVGTSPMTDYRFCWKGDFKREAMFVSEAGQFQYCLRAIKPARTATEGA